MNPADWSIFRLLQVFELTGCESITDKDVGALAYIRDLKLDTCPNITNIDALTHNDKLSIWSCEGIQRISLSNHSRHEVSIMHIPELLKITITGKVKKLELESLPYFLQITLNQLIIENAESVVSLNILGVHSLALTKCVHLEEIPPSSEIKALEMKKCKSITSIRHYNTWRVWKFLLPRNLNQSRIYHY